MDMRPLGDTGLEVSVIGFGAFKIGRNQKTKYAEAYDLPDQSEVEDLLDTILDQGITLIDTAPAYGSSEQRIGRWLKRSGARDRVVLATKVGEEFEAGISRYAFDRASVERSIDRSLEVVGGPFTLPPGAHVRETPAVDGNGERWVLDYILRSLPQTQLACVAVEVLDRGEQAVRALARVGPEEAHEEVDGAFARG